jgi:agmatinase
MTATFYKTDFLAASSSYEEGDIVLAGIPYDGTSTFRPGSRFAPDSIRTASRGLETYSVYQDDDISDVDFYDAGDLELSAGDVNKAISDISSAVKGFLDDGKKVMALGGEHLISYAIVSQLIKKYPDLVVLDFDAHADLRDSYLGEKLSHATVIRRIFELFHAREKNIYQFGIRSGTKEEFDFAEKNINMYKYDFSKVKEVLDKIGESHVYITFDLDVFDPSVLPGTGAPEPGGVSFNDFIQLTKDLAGINLVCIDIVELAPDYDSSKISSVTAAKVVREFLLLMK